jgi:hypothetical protein
MRQQGNVPVGHFVKDLISDSSGDIFRHRTLFAFQTTPYMSAYLIFLNTQAMVWDYAANSQWLSARSQRVLLTNQATVHAVMIEAEETLSEIDDFMGETLSSVDDFKVILIDDSDVPPSGEDAALDWVNQRDDWARWRGSHK